MSSHIRVLLASFAFAGFLTACGSDDSSYSTDTAADSTAVVEESTTVEAVAEAAPASGITTGMSTDAAIEMLGEPLLKQSHTINEIEVVHMEWRTSDALVSAQFHNGKAVHSQYWPAQ
ncbi:hypothetical protein MPL1_10392 [Methylophaga lonarensis MPL]|uniref:Lipoprotein n=1 Tax=Methylophaga lonarensis MPL TaxID=1286106 RepID=M7NUI4_9GAMM|nr:hypothetical protein [Methylophaga lonarensis]EMR12443.1 hypothetical protein MPL1_10392 [Methylophaga lonarensis MPL]